ncbi:hypothetical protein H0H81_008705 [Sphagnurus paluster]|uniref:DUF605-domain-containing protein n=1 Tax=Sphagnurus paluster TaxID=117069 RepID=A0A9P7KLA9_9AGAR|nr:hypothetical protein H0H81_008705 [Sphagnurus paluster]
MSSQSLFGLPPLSAALKPASPYLQRAYELERQDPIMAYWCAYYAAQLGISLKVKDSASRNVLFALLDALESLKKEIGPEEAIDSEPVSSAYVENFALRVFGMADNEDRAGSATRSTAKKFLAAANFLEVLQIFPKTEASESNEEKIKYAKWKASDIAKAFREGRKPTPGPANSNFQDTDATKPASPSPQAHTMTIDVPPSQPSASPKNERPMSPPNQSDGVYGYEAVLGPADEVIATPENWSTATTLGADISVAQEESSYTRGGQESKRSSSSSINIAGRVTHDGSDTAALHEDVEASHLAIKSDSSFGISEASGSMDKTSVPSSPVVEAYVDTGESWQPVEAYDVVDADPHPHPEYAVGFITPSPMHISSLPDPNHNPYLFSHPPAVDEHPQPPTLARQNIYTPSAPPPPPHHYGPPQAPAFELTPTLIAKAQKHSRFAISALDYEDVETARKELINALRILGG